jgi:hypothetical protein
MKGDPMVNDVVRQEKRVRRLPPDACCVICERTDNLAVSPTGYVRCHDHRSKSIWFDDVALRNARTWVELDHPAGRANLGGVTVPLSRTAHRTVTDARIAVGQDDWPAANGDPLLAVGHLVAGIGSLLWLIGKWLVDLAVWLSAKLGGDWPNEAPPGPIA